MSAKLTESEAIALYGKGSLIDALSSYEFTRDDAQINSLLVGLHNAKKIDLLKLVERGDFGKLDSSSFFSASHAFCELIPRLHEEVQRLMNAVDALVELGGDDLAASQPNSAFRAWCVENPEQAHVVIGLAVQGDEIAINNLTFALEALKDIPQAINIIKTSTGKCRLGAITALGRIERPDVASSLSILAAFQALIDDAKDDTVCGHLLRVTADIMVKDGVDNPEICQLADGLIRDLASNAGDLTLHQSAYAIWSHAAALSDGTVAFLLGKLQDVDSRNRGTIDDIDFGLKALWDKGRRQLAVDYVAELLSKPDAPCELAAFDSFCHGLVTSDSEVLGPIVVGWLRSGAYRLSRGLLEAFDGADPSGRPIKFDAARIDLSDVEVLFVCRKAIGWFFSRPITATSILISLMQVCSEKVLDDVVGYLFDPMLINYASVRDYLQGIEVAPPLKARLRKELQRDKKYLNGLRQVPFCKELQPSEQHRNIDQVRMSEMMNESFREARKKSVLAALFTESTLLFGRGSMSFHDDGENRLKPTNIDLQSHQVSMEMPRLDLIDPIGLDYRLRVMRNEQLVT